MTVGSLFTGIGGIDLGLEWAGMTTIWQSETDPYASKVLARHWPHVPNLGDITRIDWTTVERPDLICGGYPCQPFSLAGIRQGETDPRHLWPHFAHALRHLRPEWALLENVPGHLSLGFGRVLGDLAELGYDTDWDCIPAAAVGAPHLRYRVFVVAHTDHAGCSEQRGTGTTPSELAAGQRDRSVPDTDLDVVRQQPVSIGRSSSPTVAQHDGEDWELADTDREARQQHRRIIGTTHSDRAGHLHQWAAEPDVGRVADGVPARVDRLRCLGNAVVPQVAELIGHRIIEAAT